MFKNIWPFLCLFILPVAMNDKLNLNSVLSKVKFKKIFIIKQLHRSR